jgi:hypothetical protein
MPCALFVNQASWEKPRKIWTPPASNNLNDFHKIESSLLLDLLSAYNHKCLYEHCLVVWNSGGHPASSPISGLPGNRWPTRTARKAALIVSERSKDKHAPVIFIINVSTAPVSDTAFIDFQSTPSSFVSSSHLCQHSLLSFSTKKPPLQWVVR